ncbi:hypothetical protein E2C01_019340 [Portunus trituberculatus]|uniref:Uncharacterized protein n=1 Tax=Portunus trituberculatus TaxID=210409 RepID=A0A5B7DZ26_PORTR|nr:hypothetical protein [Portunus trituberculatus]
MAARKALPTPLVQCGACWLMLGAVVLQLLSDNTKVMYDWSYFIAWIGVGWTLISALLFSGASVCLRSEREREDAKNMAYLMPGNAATASLTLTMPSQANSPAAAAAAGRRKGYHTPSQGLAHTARSDMQQVTIPPVTRLLPHLKKVTTTTVAQS